MVIDAENKKDSLPLATVAALEEQMKLVESMSEYNLREYAKRMFPLFFTYFLSVPNEDRLSCVKDLLLVHHAVSRSEWTYTIRDETPREWKKVCDRGLELAKGDVEEATRIIVEKMSGKNGDGDSDGWDDCEKVLARVKSRKLGLESGRVML